MLRSVGAWCGAALGCVVMLPMVAGCSSDASYDVRVDFATDTLASDVDAIELSLVPQCPATGDVAKPVTTPISRVVLTRAGGRPRLPGVKPGTLGLHAIGRHRDTCAIVAAACEVVHIKEGGKGTLNITLEKAKGAGCDDGVTCQPSGVCGACEGAECQAPDATVMSDGGGDGAMSCDCPGVTNGDVACDGAGGCVLTCNGGYEKCMNDAACCPADDNAAVDPTHAGGRFSRVLVDPQGAVHVLYSDATTVSGTGDLHYAKRSAPGTAWTYSLVASGVKTAFALGLDPKGKPAIAYADAASDVYVALPSGSTWTKTKIGGSGKDAPGMTGSDIEVFTPDTPYLHVGWRGGVAAFLLGMWPAVPVTVTGNGDGAAITKGYALGGSIAQAYVDVGTSVPYAIAMTEAGPSPTTFPVDGLGVGGLVPPVFGDMEFAAGTVEYAYNVGTVIRYVRGRGTTWSSPVDLVTGDGRGMVHYDLFANGVLTTLSYLGSDGGTPAVRVAVRSEGGVWTQLTVATPASLAGNTSVVLDGDEGLHVTYYDGGDDRVHYAYRRTAVIDAVAP